MSKRAWFLIGICSMAIYAIVSHYFLDCGRVEKADAVEAGVAEYVIVDPKTGRTEFHWKATVASNRENE